MSERPTASDDESARRYSDTAPAEIGAARSVSNSVHAEETAT